MRKQEFRFQTNLPSPARRCSRSRPPLRRPRPLRFERLRMSGSANVESIQPRPPRPCEGSKALVGAAVVVGRNSARTDIWAPYLSPSLVPSFTLAAHSAPLVLGESSRPWRRRDEEIRENFRGANCFSLTPV